MDGAILVWVNAAVRKPTHYSASVTVGALCLICGCVAVRHHEVRAPACIPPGQSVVFSVDGAGSYFGTTHALIQVTEEDRLPISVIPVDWSHGRGRILADETDIAHSRAQGERLAAQMLAFRQAHPSSHVYLIAHSAGSMVALTAAGRLPPDSIDRIILLAPAVSADYDVRPALRSAREGIDLFTSERDVLYLRLGMALVGTADRRHTPDAAGRVGFRAIALAPEDGELFAKLRQHHWHPSVEWTGNHGGHYGAYKAEFLRAYVLPLIAPKRACVSPPDMPGCP